MIVLNKLSRKARRSIVDQAVAEAIPETTEHVESKLFKQLRSTRRVTVIGAGTDAGTIRVRFPDGGTLDVPVLKTYSTDVLGAPGGPATSQDAYLLYTSESGVPVLWSHR